MAIADYATYQAKRASPDYILRYTKIPQAGVVGRLYSLWTCAPLALAGAIPTTPAVPTKATQGALVDCSSSILPAMTSPRIVGIRGSTDATVSTTARGTYVLVDMLSHQGGMNAGLSGVQTTNLPTAAITRGTGAGCFIGIEIYAQIGATQTTFTANYTNSDGVAGRETTGILFGGTGFREVDRFFWLPLADGDTGVNSVESVTVTASTTLGGNFGVGIYRPLATLANLVNNGDNAQFDWDPILNNGGICPRFDPDACLMLLGMSEGSGTGVLDLEILIAED